MDQGQQAERQAQQYLIDQGLILIDKNVRYPFGELDLVMRQGDAWVFVEVKYRSSEQFGGAVAALSAKKMSRLQKAANCYLQQNRIQASCRFDLVAIDKQQIRWLKNVF